MSIIALQDTWNEDMVDLPIRFDYLGEHGDLDISGFRISVPIEYYVKGCISLYQTER